MATQGRRRALGQHFLKDKGIANAIAQAVLKEAARYHCQGLLEIGPGKGAITLPLLQKLKEDSQGSSISLKHFLLIERDGRLAQNSEYSQNESTFPLSIEVGDFLTLPEERWLKIQPLAVVSNLPYSAGTAILDRLARHVGQIPVMVLMFQAEVARRLRALSGTKERGSLSVWIQNRWDVEKLLLVPPGAFSPPPEVQSEVVILRRREKPWIQVSPHGPDSPSQDSKTEALWEEMLRASFAHRRKMLRSMFPWQNALELCGIDGRKRAEALDWSEWDRLFQAVRQVKS